MREELIATLKENQTALYRVALGYVKMEQEALDMGQIRAEKAERQGGQVKEK